MRARAGNDGRALITGTGETGAGRVEEREREELRRGGERKREVISNAVDNMERD